MEMGSQVAIVQQQRSVREQQLSVFVLGERFGRGKSGRGGKLGIFTNYSTDTNTDEIEMR